MLEFLSRRPRSLTGLALPWAYSGKRKQEVLLFMERFTRKQQGFDWSALVAALAVLVIGIIILIWPAASSRVLVYVIAGAIGITGLIRIVLYLAHREDFSPFSFGGLAFGLSLLSLGIFLLAKPDVLIFILPTALGCVLIFSGFGSLQRALDLLRLKIRRWYIPLIFALVSLICGFIALIDPFDAAQVLMLFLGFSLCGEAVLLLVSLFLFRGEGF